MAHACFFLPLGPNLLTRICNGHVQLSSLYTYWVSLFFSAACILFIYHVHEYNIKQWKQLHTRIWEKT
jgi:hypothetical protein